MTTLLARRNHGLGLRTRAGVDRGAKSASSHVIPRGRHFALDKIWSVVARVFGAFRRPKEASRKNAQASCIVESEWKEGHTLRRGSPVSTRRGESLAILPVIHSVMSVLAFGLLSIVFCTSLAALQSEKDCTGEVWGMIDAAQRGRTAAIEGIEKDTKCIATWSQKYDGKTTLHLIADSANSIKEPPAWELTGRLIDWGADPLLRDSSDATPLHTAAKHAKNPNLLAVLIDAGAPRDAMAENEQTPLQWAMAHQPPNDMASATLVMFSAAIQDQKRSTPIVRSLHRTKDKNCRGNMDQVAELLEWTPVHRLAYCYPHPGPYTADRTNTADSLLVQDSIFSLLEQDSTLLTAPDRLGRIPLHYAAFGSGLTYLWKTHHAGQHTDAAAFGDSIGVTPFHLAAAFTPDANLLDWLHKLDTASVLTPLVRSTTKYGKTTPLAWAVTYNTSPMATKWLVCLSTRDNQEDSANCLGQADTRSAGDSLSRSSAIGLRPVGALGQTALHRAVSYNQLAIVHLLLQYGARIWHEDDMERHAVHWSVIAMKNKEDLSGRMTVIDRLACGSALHIGADHIRGELDVYKRSPVYYHPQVTIPWNDARKPLCKRLGIEYDP